MCQIERGHGEADKGDICTHRPHFRPQIAKYLVGGQEGGCRILPFHEAAFYRSSGKVTATRPAHGVDHGVTPTALVQQKAVIVMDAMGPRV
jgi:hypothetical protein